MKKLYILIFTILISALSFGQIINEIDPNQEGADTTEFIEVKWTPDTVLDGYIVVLFNGVSDTSYDTVDLTGFVTDTNGLYLINFAPSGIQNGADAAAIYQDLKANFPNGTLVTQVNLIDAIVYGNNDPDDSGLLTGLGETIQYNDTTTESLNQSDDGTFYNATPSSGAINNTLSNKYNQIQGFLAYPNPASFGYIMLSSKSKSDIDVSVFDILGKQMLSKTITNNKLDVTRLTSGVYIMKVTQDNATSTQKLVVK